MVDERVNTLHHDIYYRTIYNDKKIYHISFEGDMSIIDNNFHSEINGTFRQTDG